MPLSTNRKIGLAIGSASLFVAALGVLGVLSTRRLVADAAWVAHSHEVRSELRELTAQIDGAKADVRGYLLTRDSAYLALHRSHVASTERAFQHLDRLTADNPAQQRRLADIRRRLTAREAALDTTIVLRRTPALESVDVGPRLAIGERLAAGIDSVIAAADTAEQALLAARSTRESASEVIVIVVSLVLVLSAIGFAVVLGRSIRRDFTGRLQAEAALRASEEKFAGILAIGADAIITTDERQSILHFNHGAEEVFGYTKEEVVGRPLEILLPARHQIAHRAHVESFSTSPEVARHMGQRRVIHGRRKTGEEFPAEASISKLRTADGLLFTAVVRDVTEHTRLERHERALATAGMLLSQSLDFERTLLAVASLPAPSVGAWGVLDVVEESEGGQPALRRVASRHGDSAVDAALAEWQAAGVDWDSPEPAIDVLRTGRPLHIPAVSDDWLESHLASERQIELARRMDTHSLIVVPLLVHDEAIGALTIGAAPGHVFDEHDLALAVALAERAALAIENARLFQRAQRATAARDHVLGVVSHDLRNPLSAVSMLASRLAERPLNDQERRVLGGHMVTAANSMHRLMEDLLDAASIEAGTLSVEVEPQALHQILGPVIAIFEERATARRIALREEEPMPDPVVLADGERVVQVMSNLVGNALKFTPAGGTVLIGSAVKDNETVVWVRDNGPGIPERDQAHVFDRFWHARGKSPTRGTGLGLAIARGIVRAHGGRIWLESVEGAGSTFYFTLPVANLIVQGGGPVGLPS